VNFIANETAQKLRGGFYTDSDIAGFLSAWVLEINPARVLEPSCGDGSFLEALLRLNNPGLERLLAFELDPVEADKARQRVAHRTRSETEVRQADFLKRFVFNRSELGLFDGVVGNPPFIRYQYLPDDQQFLAEKVIRGFGLPFTKHTNAWVPFVVAAVSLLAPGGRLGMVIPAELFHIAHAQSARSFLLSQCSRVLVLDPEELWFEQALQGVVLLLAEKKRSPGVDGVGVAVEPLASRKSLLGPAATFLDSAQFTSAADLERKWMPLFLTPQERALMDGIRTDARFRTFAELAEVDVGIVTGANEFFLVSDEVVQEFGLRPWAHPMFGKSEHVAGLIYTELDHQANRATGLPTNFLWFDGVELDAFPPRVRQYLLSGVEQGLNKRFKCRVRRPWYRVPSIYATPVTMLKRAHHFPRLVLNQANAFSTDTAYRIRPKAISGAALVYAFLNSLTCLAAELEGRHYGGGVLELVPSEIERLLLPRVPATDAELAELDLWFRDRNGDPALLREQDGRVLGAAGLSGADQEVLHAAWNRLRQRRQRTRDPRPSAVSSNPE
jgi:adenine-specific DNA methylase